MMSWYSMSNPRERMVWTSFFPWLYGRRVCAYLNEDGDFRQICLPGFFWKAFKACSGSVFAVDGREESHRYSSTHNGQPYSSTNHCCVPASADGARAERIHYGQEAVYIDASEEKHAAIDVGDEGCSWNLAQSVSKWPVSIDIVEDLEWQSKNKN